jgi:hypothetical protein
VNRWSGVDADVCGVILVVRIPTTKKLPANLGYSKYVEEDQKRVQRLRKSGIESTERMNESLVADLKGVAAECYPQTWQKARIFSRSGVELYGWVFRAA